MTDGAAIPGGGVVLRPVQPGSTRRTTTLTVEPRGSWDNGKLITAVGRDLRRPGDPEESASVVTDAFAFDLDPAGQIVPHTDGSTAPAQLAGVAAQRGLRKVVAGLRERPDAAEHLGPADGLRDALLDDVPGLLVASGYGRLYEGVVAGPDGKLQGPAMMACVGFHQLARHGEEFSTRLFLDRAAMPDFVTGDPLVWHDDVPLPPGAVRRRRLLEVTPAGDGIEVEGYFRDTFRRPDGSETVIHEYGLAARVVGDPFGDEPLVIARVEARPGDLPLTHCPLAASGAALLEGVPLVEVEREVRARLRGPQACTHLNDELRSLRAIRTLVAPADVAATS